MWTTGKGLGRDTFKELEIVWRTFKRVPHFLTLSAPVSQNGQKWRLYIRGNKVTKQLQGKILDVIDNELKFDPHVRSMCTKAAQKLGVLNRIS